MVTIPPGSMIGILGGGQLGRMLAMAAAGLGYRTHIFCPESNSPAMDAASCSTVAEYDDFAALDGFLESVDIVTYEFENIPLETASYVETKGLLRPSAQALAVTQDRLTEKNFVRDCGVVTAEFVDFSTAEELKDALRHTGQPALVKTRRFGYDGKGQYKIVSGRDADDIMNALDGADAIVEQIINFDREVSVIIARSESGDIAAYPLCENTHVDGILAETRVPAKVPQNTEIKAKVLATKIANKLDYVGVLTIELFCDDAGTMLLVNEMAPRVHNSGHWTIEGAVTSQFEQHIRAICGLPLGATDALGQISMHNLLGDEIMNWNQILEDGSSHYHHYGKRTPRPGRKMGHVTKVELPTQ